jgi:hypothetical protein
MLITFFDFSSIVHFKFIPQGQTVNRAYYVEILKPLRQAVYRKGREVWANDWIFHHDNVLGHKVLSVKQFLAQRSVTKR